jgi:hypothetical protein
VTLPFVLSLAEHGVAAALRADPHLRNGLNICRGAVTRPEVAAELGYPYVDPESALKRVDARQDGAFRAGNTGERRGTQGASHDL